MTTKVNNEAEVIRQWAAEMGARVAKLRKRGICITSDRPRKYFYVSTQEVHEQEEKKIINLRQHYMTCYTNIVQR